MATLDIIVGSWDDISEHTEMLADRHVRVVVLPKPAEGKTAALSIPQEETERILDELADIGTDSPAWPEECCAHVAADPEKESD